MSELQATLRFDGDDYVPARDNPRLTGQIGRVVTAMRGETWRTLREIADETGDPEASVSAQLRHLRKERFGSHKVHRRHDGGGVYRYRVEFNGWAPGPVVVAEGKGKF